MLRELHIANLAVIEDAAVEFSSGLNVFTGRTGAGKSLVIGAFEILLGLRSGGKEDAGAMLRDEDREARISGLFEVADTRVTQELGAAIDKELAASEPILVTRRILPSGRTSASVNGAPVTIPMLRNLADLLVDIHGQHDHQFLLKPGNQLLILDAYAGCDDARTAFAGAFRELRDLKRRKRALEESAESRARELELLEYQSAEIAGAEPRDGELEALQAEYERLANTGELVTGASSCADELHESEGSVVERLEILGTTLKQLAEKDPEKLAPIREQVAECAAILRDAAYELSGYAEALEPDEGRLEEVRRRLDQLNTLVYKYGGSMESVMSTWREIDERLEALRAAGGDLGGLADRIARLDKEVARKGAQLSGLRREAVDRLAPLITEKIRSLGMEGAAFAVEIKPVDPASPEATSSGLDDIEFMVQTNPGQPRRPLRKIASGGEISRIMLAIKSVMAAGDRISVLVFDEIDANIGGRLGAEIGSCMKQLADARTGRQVLCITHMPQIAAFADHHLHIEKEISTEGDAAVTSSSVSVLDGEGRLAELAAMIAGSVTETSLQQAGELLARAEQRAAEDPVAG